MIIRKIPFLMWCLPLVLAQFVANGVDLVGQVLVTQSRFIFLLLLLFYILMKSSNFIELKREFFIVFVLLCYVTWCLLTTAWSIVPVLSGLKSMALFFIVFTLVLVGYVWTKQIGYQDVIKGLLLIAVLSVVVSFKRDHYMHFNEVEAFSGMSGNPNYLGMIEVMAMPFFLWKAYVHRLSFKKAMKYYALLGFNIVLLLSSYARSSIVAAVIIILFFLLSLALKKQVKLLLSLMALLMIFACVVPSFNLDQKIHQYLYKGSTDGDMLNSRRQLWQESWALAVQGGVFGAGYGATIGQEEFHFEGLSSSRYGREKGNAQLAIIEETGFIGLGLYFLLLIVYFASLFSFYQQLRGEKKVILSIVMGTLLGLIALSCFEAWWDAPLSPEAIYFWTFFGIALGVKHDIQRKHHYADTAMEESAGKILPTPFPRRA